MAAALNGTIMDTKAYDVFTGAVRAIDTDHSYIHYGGGFTCSKVLTLAGNATTDCILKTASIADSRKYVHIRPIRISSSASALEVTFAEAPTYTGGTEITGSFNRNRNSAHLPFTKLYDTNVSVTETGTVLTVNYIGVGGNPSSAAGGSLSGTVDEIVLKPETAYLIRLKNQTSTQTIVDIDLFWYEEDEG